MRDLSIFPPFVAFFLVEEDDLTLPILDFSIASMSYHMTYHCPPSS